MNKSGIVSKACIAHHYWHNMDDPKCFFKIMIGDFKNGVTIPKKFVANIREQMSKQVTLKVPDGKTYTIEVAEEQQNEVVLRSGWAEFASAYEIEQYDLLVFKNSGNSLLKVRIFGPSGCEKELSCVPLDSILCMQERKVSHGKQLQSPTGKRLAVGSPSDSNRKAPKVNPADSPSQKKRHVSPTKRHGVAKPPYMLPRHTSQTDEQRSKVEEKVGAVQSETPKTNPTNSPSQKKRHVSPTKRHGVAKPPYMLPRHTSPTDEQRSKEKEKVGAVQSETPKMNPIDSPSQKKSIHQEPINSGASQKLIKYCIDLPTGWSMTSQQEAEVRHNKLQEGDICIFQPSKRKEGVKLIFHPLVQNCRLQSPGHVPSAKSPRHGAAKPPYILPRFTSLTDEQKSKVEKKLRGIQSEIPEFGSGYARKYLTGGDKSQRTMTMRLRCPGRSKGDEWETEFRVMCRRHWIVGGWRKFVTDNKLKLDDICLFNLRNTKTLTMDVHIIH